MKQVNADKKIEDLLIRKEVDKICRSGEFKSKGLLCRFLNYIVSEYLAGRGQNIKGYSIGVDVFNRGHDFDPSQDALVRIHAGRLRRLLDHYYLKDGIKDKIKIEIPKGAYIPIFSYNPTSFLSNIELYNSENKELVIEPTVAILPFKNLTGNQEKEFFAQGFSEELSVELTRYEDLIVFDGVREDPFINGESINHEHFRKKGIRFLIQGSIKRCDDQVRILVKLTDTFEGKQIWAECYQNRLSADNLIGIQEKITKEIAGVLGSEYGIILQELSRDSFRVKTLKLDSYIAVLKFYYFEMQQTSETFSEAFIALNKALEDDKQSGTVTAMLSILHGNHYMLDSPGASKSFESMGIMAERAAKLDPHSTIVNVALAFKHFAYDEKESFFLIVDKSLAKNPTNSARLGALAFYLCLFGDWERGKKILDDLKNINIKLPLYFYGSTMLYYYRKKDYHNALTEAKKYDMPTIFWAPMLRAAVLGQLNEPEDARANIIHLKKLKPDFEEKSRELIKRYVKEEELVDHIIDGLRKAGLDIP